LRSELLEGKRRSEDVNNGKRVNKSEFFLGYWDAQIPWGRVKQKVILGMRIYHWDYEAFYRT
jgi:hypothetical protein